MDAKSVVIAFIALTIPGASLADEEATSATRYTDRSNRWEGLQRIPTSGTSIALQSFLSYAQPATLSDTLNLTVRFYLQRDASAFLKATEKRRSGASHYQMRPFETSWRSGWNEFSPWPAREVLVPLGITPERLGVLVRLDSDRQGSGHVSPAILYATSYPPAISSYEMTFLPNVTLSDVSYTLTNTQTGMKAASGQMKNVAANVPFDLVLDLSGQPAGEYRMLIKGQELGRTKGPSRQYFFYHEPDPGG